MTNTATGKWILISREALVEIKAVGKKEPVLAAEGAELFLEKLAPAIEGVDSSGGAIGTTVNRTTETLVPPIIAKGDVSRAVREKFLDRFWGGYPGRCDALPGIDG